MAVMCAFKLVLTKMAIKSLQKRPNLASPLKNTPIKCIPILKYLCEKLVRVLLILSARPNLIILALCSISGKKLQPYIYKSSYQGWYCMGHEAFFTDKEVEATSGICPDHQTPYERISEENYYLKTSASSHTYITCSGSPGTGTPQLRLFLGREILTS